MGTREIILEVVAGVRNSCGIRESPEKRDFMSHGEFFASAVDIGYEGTQEYLEGVAGKLLEEEEIDGREIGRSQLVCYREKTVGGMV